MKLISNTIIKYVIVGTCVISGLLFYFKTQRLLIPVVIGGVPMRLEIADTESLRQKGLSGRNFLAGGEGVLFVFERPAFHGFWMKDMKFAIDILWFDKECVLVSKNVGVRPETFPEVFYPDKEVMYVLETNALASEAFQFVEGKGGDFCHLYTK